MLVVGSLNACIVQFVFICVTHIYMYVILVLLTMYFIFYSLACLPNIYNCHTFTGLVE
jgi:hypothetical protein